MKTYLECLSRAAEVTDQVALSANIKLTLSDDELILLQQAADIYAEQSNSHKHGVMQVPNVSTRTFNVGDKVQWRGMDLIVVEVGVNEILIATSENVDDENYNDWWVGTQYVR